MTSESHDRPHPSDPLAVPPAIAARLWGCSLAELDRLTADGLLDYHLAGGRVRYRLGDLRRERDARETRP